MKREEEEKSFAMRIPGQTEINIETQMPSCTHPWAWDRAHTFSHRTPQYPIADSQPQTTQPETTTMETHQSTSSDSDDHMGQETPAAAHGRRFDPRTEPKIQKKNKLARNVH